MAYRPKAKNNVVKVQADSSLTLRTELDRFWSMEDGSLWARGPDGMIRFNGKSWQAITLLKGEVIQYLVVGNKDLVLAHTDDDKWILVQNDFVAKNDSLLSLIKSNRERIVKGFSGSVHQGRIDLRTFVVVDSKNNVWVSSKDGVEVLIDDHWKRVDQPLSNPDFSNQRLMGIVITNLEDRVYINGQTIGPPVHQRFSRV
jgi:ligand-binding sensor domain-containing protein